MFWNPEFRSMLNLICFILKMIYDKYNKFKNNIKTWEEEFVQTYWYIEEGKTEETKLHMFKIFLLLVLIKYLIFASYMYFDHIFIKNM